MSFSLETKHEIHNRAHECSEVSGDHTRPLECSHLFHSKDVPEYNTPDMGILMTDIEHYAYHLMFRGCPNEIGLTPAHNQYAIMAIWERIKCYNTKNNISNDIESLKSLVVRATNYLQLYLCIEP